MLVKIIDGITFIAAIVGFFCQSMEPKSLLGTLCIAWCIGVAGGYAWCRMSEWE